MPTSFTITTRYTTQAQLDADRERVKAQVGDRVSWMGTHGTHMFGDVVKINRASTFTQLALSRTFKVVDRKFPGETTYTVDKALIYKLIPQDELITLNLTKETT